MVFERSTGLNVILTVIWKELENHWSLLFVGWSFSIAVITVLFLHGERLPTLFLARSMMVMIVGSYLILLIIYSNHSCKLQLALSFCVFLFSRSTTPYWNKTITVFCFILLFQLKSYQPEVIHRDEVYLINVEKVVYRFNESACVCVLSEKSLRL